MHRDCEDDNRETHQPICHMPDASWPQDAMRRARGWLPLFLGEALQATSLCSCRSSAYNPRAT